MIKTAGLSPDAGLSPALSAMTGDAQNRRAVEGRGAARAALDEGEICEGRWARCVSVI